MYFPSLFDADGQLENGACVTVNSNVTDDFRVRLRIYICWSQIENESQLSSNAHPFFCSWLCEMARCYRVISFVVSWWNFTPLVCMKTVKTKKLWEDFLFFRDPLLIFLGRGFTLDRFEKPDFITNWHFYLLLFAVEPLKGLFFVKLWHLCFWWVLFELAKL